MNWKKLLVIGVSLVFIFSVFKNISHPLLWNDEGETAEYAKRILLYGYPKVTHQGKILNLAVLSDKKYTIREEIDAWIALPWVQYYFATLGVFASTFFTNLYTKTFWVRFPFALLGSVGVVMLGIFISRRQKMKYLYFSLFMLFEILSVPLALHLREVRSYPITLFLTSLLLIVFLKRPVDHILTAVLLVLLFNTFPPAFIASLFGLGVFLVFNKSHPKKFAPLVLSALISIPFALFYKTFSTVSYVSGGYNYDFSSFIFNIGWIISFFTRQEFLLLALFLKLVFYFVYFARKKREELAENFKVSILLFVFFVISVLVIARVPYMFERYVIWLQPLLIAGMLVDLLAAIEYSSRREVIIYASVIIFALCCIGKVDSIRGHIYELTHIYKGPMDYVIPYIKDNYSRPEDLVIATNYEEPVYMFYLDSKMIVGYTGSNLEEDKKLLPDIVIARYGRPNYVEVLAQYLEQGKYKKTIFPIFDYQFNNIADLSIPLGHLFETKYTDSEEGALTIYERE